jgi:hypothetical protein
MKRMILVISLIFVILLTGCYSKELREESKLKVDLYSDDFERQVKNAYGEGAKLKNISCEIYSGSPGPIPTISYWTSDLLEADLILNDNKYYARYSTRSPQKTSTDVYSNDIIQDFISILPIDSTKIAYYISDDGTDNCEKTTFDSSIKSFSDTLNVDSHLNLYIITTENIEKLEESDFINSPRIAELKNSKLSFSVKIFSIDKENILKVPKEQVKSISISISYSTQEPVKKLSNNNTSYDPDYLAEIVSAIEFSNGFGNFSYDSYNKY